MSPISMFYYKTPKNESRRVKKYKIAVPRLLAYIQYLVKAMLS